MPTMTEYRPGTFCWVDLSTSEPSVAKKFYSELFGWTANDVPMGENQVYSIMQKNGNDAAAISPSMQPGAPPVWNSYISVEDVGAATEKAASLGAKVAMGPMDVMTAGKMSVIQDPSGAYVSLWQAGNHIGAKVVNETGAFSWNELLTSDKSAASAFYQKLLGWTMEDSPMGEGMTYTTIKNQGNMNGGMMDIRPEWGPMPSNWGVYFTVSDCDATAEKIKELGGKIIMGPQDIPGTGRFATAQDPQGAFFNIITMAAPQS